MGVLPMCKSKQLNTHIAITQITQEEYSAKGQANGSFTNVPRLLFAHLIALLFNPLLGDPESARGGVTARRILSCLQEQLPTIAEPGMTFMQDDSPTHTARIVQRWLRNWLQENGLEMFDWPPYSPDLDPIENLWKLLKEKICEALFPSSQTCRRTTRACSGFLRGCC